MSKLLFISSAAPVGWALFSQTTDNDKDITTMTEKNKNTPKVDRLGRRVLITGAEAERQEKQSEAAQLMARLALILDKTRPMDQHLYRLRRKRCMKIVWHRRGRNEDAILTEMLRWLRNKVAKLTAKEKKDETEQEEAR